jgi:hypothetical protein
MATHTSLPNEKLSPWYFAARYAALVLEQRIALADEKAWPCEYDRRQLQVLMELEEFLNSSWNAWMDSTEEQLRGNFAVLNEVTQ